MGLHITTSNIQVQLLAQTGDGQILGNLLYNVANLLNAVGSLNLLTILNELALQAARQSTRRRPGRTPGGSAGPSPCPPPRRPL